MSPIWKADPWISLFKPKRIEWLEIYLDFASSTEKQLILEHCLKTFHGPSKGNARVVVSAQKPFTLSYSRKGLYVVINRYYKFTNAFMDVFLKAEIACCKTDRLTLRCSCKF